MPGGGEAGAHMSKKFPYTYTILRYVHDVMTGEFINVGVVMHVPSQRQLLARTRTTIGRCVQRADRTDAFHARAVQQGNLLVECHFFNHYRCTFFREELGIHPRVASVGLRKRHGKGENAYSNDFEEKKDRFAHHLLFRRLHKMASFQMSFVNIAPTSLIRYSSAIRVDFIVGWPSFSTFAGLDRLLGPFAGWISCLRPVAKQATVAFDKCKCIGLFNTRA